MSARERILSTVRGYERWTKVLLTAFAIGVGIPLVLAPEALSFHWATDDTFYYHVLADNTLAGHGVVFNHGEATNGFHPLWFLLILTIRTFVPGLELPIITVMMVSLALHSLVGLLLYRALKLVRNRTAGLLGATLWLFHPVGLGYTLSGMEPILQVAVLGILAYVFVSRDWRKPNHRALALLGVLIAGVFLARMDGVFIGIGVAIGLVRRRIGDLKTWKEVRKQTDLILGAFVAFGLVTPWLGWSVVQTGHVFPTSGAAIRDTELAFDTFPALGNRPRLGYLIDCYEAGVMILSEIVKWFTWGAIESVTVFGSVGLGAGPFDLALIYVACVTVTCLVLGGILTTGRLKSPNWVWTFDWLLIGSGLTLVYYTFYGLRYRHYYVLSLYFVFAVVGGLLTEGVVQRLSQRWSSRSQGIVSGIIGVLLVSFLVHQAVLTGAIVSDTRSSGLYEEAEFINEELPADAQVGNFNTGYAQYFTPDHDVYNLDGVINTPAFEARRDGRIDCYVIERDIDYIVGFAGRPQRVFGNPALAVGDVLNLERIDKGDSFDSESLGAYRITVKNEQRCGTQ